MGTQATAPDLAPDLVLPAAAAFAFIVAPLSPRSSTVRRLHHLLVSLDPQKEPIEREAQLIGLASWVRAGGKPPELADMPGNTRGQTRRFFVLVSAVEKFPLFRERLSRVIGTLLLEQAAHRFFARMGIPGDGGLLAETVDRLSRRLMPQPNNEEDITQLLERLFPKHADAEWLSALPSDLLLRFVSSLRTPNPQENLEPLGVRAASSASLGSHPSLPDARASLSGGGTSYSIWAPLSSAILDAILLLASRVSSAGLSDVIRARSPVKKLRDSPFFQLPRLIDALLATSKHDHEEIEAWADDCRVILLECREMAAAVLERLEQTGVSVDVVYRIELIERSLSRIELLLELLLPRSPLEHVHRGAELLAVLLDERRRDLSLTDIVRTNTHFLARKIIERAGHSGEHYITVTPAQYFHMLLSAGGGGIVTAFTAAGKYFVSHWHRPPLQEGLLNATNFAGSFVGMQLLGLTLATKQPSMTAAALAGAIHEGEIDHDALVTTVARLVRSQLAAAFGNVAMVIPAALALDWYWLQRHGSHLFSAAYAEKTIAGFHPLSSGTVPYAALTGVLLWISSLCAGWLENWAVYRRLPEAIAEHRIRRIVGQRATRWASRVFARHIAGFGGSTSLGLMLGLTGAVGQFAGLPLEVRHVTLSTGALTYSVASQGSNTMLTPEFHSAVIGIALILMLNLGVSFGLAIVVALRAREVSLWTGLRVAWIILLGFSRSPLRFFLPIEKAAPTKSGVDV